jgi:hypothetical protein
VVVGVIERICVAWGGSGGIEMHHRSWADRTSSHKGTFLVVDADTYIDHLRASVRRMRKAGEVVGSKKRGRDVRWCLKPRQGRNRPADALLVVRCVDREGERKCWRLEKIVSVEEREGRT